ncbi:hypothetical protein AB0M80_18675 [Amycolatopsis sp. NPDC051045]|uniref:hypothetical protein n=1 Tax=Amycolatopsis sp. NPDC051045 TaxID=3156922 RepID=UPI00343CD9CE
MTSATAPGPALRALHEAMATFPVDRNVFAIISTLPEVQPSVLQAACDPTSPRLLAWPVYRGIVQACGAGEAEAKVVFTRFLAAKAEQDDGSGVLDPPARGRLDLTPVARATTGAPPASPADPPTIPRLQLPAPLTRGPRPAAPPPRLRQITSRADFARYLKALVDETGLTYRAIEDNTRKLNRKAVSCRSTLSENLRNNKPPTGEAVVATLLAVLYAELAGTTAVDEPVRRRTAETLEVWRHVMRPPPGAPVLAARAGYDPLVHTALAKLARAEQTARDIGSPDAPGLAHARRILLELLT